MALCSRLAAHGLHSALTWSSVLGAASGLWEICAWPHADLSVAGTGDQLLTAFSQASEPGRGLGCLFPEDAAFPAKCLCVCARARVCTCVCVRARVYVCVCVRACVQGSTEKLFSLVLGLC